MYTLKILMFCYSISAGITVSIPSNDMHGQANGTIRRNYAEPRVSTLPRLQEHDDGPTHTDIPVTRPLQVAETGLFIAT